MLKRSALICFSVLAISLIATVLHLFGSGRLTREMVKDFGYYRWTHGNAKFQPHYLETFERDYRFRQRFIGQSIESLRPLFPKLHSGRDYNPASYRGKNVRSFFSRYPGLRHEDFWLSGTEGEFGYCVLVVDGKIADFFFVKG